MPVQDDTGDIEADPLSPGWLRPAVWISIPVSMLGFGMAVFSILDITSVREGRTVTGGSVMAAVGGAEPAPALRRVVAIPPASAMGVPTPEDARLAWLRAEGAAERARIEALLNSAQVLAEAEPPEAEIGPVPDHGGADGRASGLEFVGLPATSPALPPVPEPPAEVPVGTAAIPRTPDSGRPGGGAEGLPVALLLDMPAVPPAPVTASAPRPGEPPAAPVGPPSVPGLALVAAVAPLPSPGPPEPVEDRPGEVAAVLPVAAAALPQPPAGRTGDQPAPVRMEVTGREVRAVEPSRAASLRGGTRRVAAEAPRRQAADPRCAPLLVQLQLGGRPTDADRSLLRTVCAPRR